MKEQTLSGWERGSGGCPPLLGRHLQLEFLGKSTSSSSFCLAQARTNLFQKSDIKMEDFVSAFLQLSSIKDFYKTSGPPPPLIFNSVHLWLSVMNRINWYRQPVRQTRRKMKNSLFSWLYPFACFEPNSDLEFWKINSLTDKHKTLE